MKILIIDDHPKIRENIKKYLALSGYATDCSHIGTEGLDLLQTNTYDAIILDMNMPIMGGREFLQIFRLIDHTTPVIALTSDSMTQDKVKVLGLGADDYLTKPFSLEELLARIQAITRRKGSITAEVVKYGPYIVDLSNNHILHEDQKIDLTHKEWLIFATLFENLGRPRSKSELTNIVWGDSEENWTSMTLEAHIYSLRKKLGRGVIVTKRNVGYSIPTAFQSAP